MNKYRPIEGMTVPRFADIATFFRLPVIKDLNKLAWLLLLVCGGLQ